MAKELKKLLGALTVCLLVALNSLVLRADSKQQEQPRKVNESNKSSKNKSQEKKAAPPSSEQKEVELDDQKMARKAVVRDATEQLELAADELKGIDSLYLSLPMARPVVKKLAKYNPAKCRELLETLFDKAEQQVEKDAEKLKTGNDRYFYQRDLRTIISIAASFDAKLAEDFTERLANSKKFSVVVENNSDGHFSAANELVSSNPQQAIAVASKAIGEEFTTRALEFIDSLRSKDPRLAQTYLSALLQSLAARKYPSVNELFLLHAYVFLSKQLPTFNPSDGRLYWIQNVNYGRDLETQTVDSELARRFLQLSVSIILQQDRYLDSLGTYKADARADLIFIDAILLPEVKRYLPNAVDSLLERRAQLMAPLYPAAQESIKDSTSQFRAAREGTPPTRDNLLRQAEETKDNKDKRDKLYYEAAQRALENKEYSKALELVGKISAPKVKNTAKEFVLFDIALAELKSGKNQEARQWMSDITDPVQRCYLLTLIARTFAEGKNKDLQLADVTLGEVGEAVGGLPSGTEKFAVLAGIAAVYSRIDSNRAIDYLRRAVEAANAADKFDGNLLVQRTLYLDHFYYVHGLYRDELTFNEAITRLAKQNFNVLIIIGRTLSDQVARVKFIVAACEPVL